MDLANSLNLLMRILWQKGIVTVYKTYISFTNSFFKLLIPSYSFQNNKFSKPYKLRFNKFPGAGNTEKPLQNMNHNLYGAKMQQSFWWKNRVTNDDHHTQSIGTDETLRYANVPVRSYFGISQISRIFSFVQRFLSPRVWMKSFIADVTVFGRGPFFTAFDFCYVLTASCNSIIFMD